MTIKPAADQVNQLVERVYAATAKDGREWFQDIGISHDRDPKTGEIAWYVSYINSGGWKNNTQGSTLREALRAWLAEYEHHYDNGPYPP